MSLDTVSKILFALYPEHNIRVALYHNVSDPFATAKLLQGHNRFILMDATNIISTSHIAIGAAVALQRRQDSLMKENNKSYESIADDNLNDWSNITKDVIVCMGGSTHVQSVLTEFAFEYIEESEIDPPRSYSAVALGVNFSSDEEFLSTAHNLGLPRAESILSRNGFFSRMRSDVEMKNLARIYKLTNEELQLGNSSLENAILTRIATKFNI